jgi:hypothetical protein
MNLFPPYTVSAISNFFPKICSDIHSSKYITGVLDTDGKCKKSSIINVFLILFKHLWVVELTYR